MTSTWHNCYSAGWQGEIVPEAFAHPAKFGRVLIQRIYEHSFEQGWLKAGDTVIDPFGGVALGGLDAAIRGVQWIGCELEPKFHKLGNANIDLWEARYERLPKWQRPILLNGDSRKLVAITGGQAMVAVPSPPYIDSVNSGKSGIDWAKAERPERWGTPETRNGCQATGQHQMAYGKSDGQIGAMPEGSIDGVISSPPFGSNCEGSIKGSKVSFVPDHGKGHSSSLEARQRQLKRDEEKTYGESEGQLARLQEGSIDAALSSPPYAAIATGAGGLNTKPASKPGQQSGRSAKASSQDTDQRYGETSGQLASLTEGSVDAAVSSPPFDAQMNQGGSSTSRIYQKWCEQNGRNPDSANAKTQGASKQWGDNPEQLGNQAGETFWVASRQIIEQVHLLLKPGGHAIWVLKDFVRKKQIVPFCDNWRKLCEAVGFRTVCQHQAMLIELSQAQGLLDGGEHIQKKERKSFFRRLAEKKGSPAINWEMVLCMEK